MMTVLDAVNEFKGVWGNCDLAQIYGGWYTNQIKSLSHGGRQICTREEFNECVKECSNNFGRCVVTWDEHKEYWRKIQLEQACKMARAELMEAQPTKPIYTKAMSNHNILPRVGMECIGKRFHQSDNQFKHCFIIGKNKEGDYLVFERNSKIEQHNINNGVWEFKPIDTSSDKEKAIDEFMKENLKGGIAFKHLISLAYDKWVK